MRSLFVNCGEIGPVAPAPSQDPCTAQLWAGTHSQTRRSHQRSRDAHHRPALQRCSSRGQGRPGAEPGRAVPACMPPPAPGGSQGNSGTAALQGWAGRAGHSLRCSSNSRWCLTKRARVSRATTRHSPACQTPRGWGRPGHTFLRKLAVNPHGHQLLLHREPPAVSPLQPAVPDLAGTWGHVGSALLHLLPQGCLGWEVGSPNLPLSLRRGSLHPTGAGRDPRVVVQ